MHIINQVSWRHPHMRILDRDKPLSDCWNRDFYRFQIKCFTVLLAVFYLTHTGPGNVVMQIGV